jgi:hypothetical protein
MMTTRLLVPALLLALVGDGRAQEPKPPSSPELQKAFAKAKVHNQRVLAILTDQSIDLAALLKKDRTLSRPLLYEFETVQLVGDAADAMAVAQKMPEALQDKPALLVLDADGKVLAKLARDSFRPEGKLASGQLLELLKPHYAPPVDAEQKLAAALATGKQDGRAVFIRFDAPW